MQYPLISEYVAAIRDAKENLDELAYLEPVLDNHGEPYRSSGAFAVVFKMKDPKTGRNYALKCFTDEQEGRSEAYRQIAEELEFVDSTYITAVKYLEQELFVDSSCNDEVFPVLLMDWVDGETMETYVADHYADSHAMAMLCYRFCKMAGWIRSQSFAHGDIKPDNIMVRPDGTLTLVDYDGMYVAAMKGRKSPTIGTKDFAHPLRTVDDFDETIDDFALAVIALSLKAISLDPSLYTTYGASDRLLFAASDFLDLSKSKVLAALQSLLADEELKTLLSMFLMASAKKNLSMCSFRLFGLKMPHCELSKEEEVLSTEVTEEEVLSTEVTEEDIRNGVQDEFGVTYSKDGKKLLKAPRRNLSGHYMIKEGTKVICNGAFCWCRSINGINIPDSVTSIGKSVFSSCSSLTSINIPDSVIKMTGNPFAGWHGSLYNESKSFIYENHVLFNADKTIIIAYRADEELYNIPDSVISIEDYAFYECKSLTNINIPDSVTNIGDRAFSRCVSLININIPDSVVKMAGNPFADWHGSLYNESKSFIYENHVLFNADKTIIIAYRADDELYNIPNTVKSIGESAFYECKSLTSINIPDGVTSIADEAFHGCKSLISINIPGSVTSIGDSAFDWCESLTSINIPHSVTSIGKSAFNGCKSLTSLNIPDNVTSIGDSAFSGCKSLTNINIPDSVTSIGDSAFSGCESLTSINIPHSVTSIGDSAFGGCSSLKCINIPGSVIKMEGNPFVRWHGSLYNESESFIYENYVLFNADKTIIIAYRTAAELYNVPNTVTSIGNAAFSGCESLTSINIPDSVTNIGNSAFSGCESLTSINIPDSVTNIGNSAFNGCYHLKCINIPDGVTNIGHEAFNGCESLTNINIPDSVTNIGNRAFSGCKSLTSINIPDSVTSIRDLAFYRCSSLNSINIPDSVTSIGYAAFSLCESLTCINIPDDVTNIGRSAFDCCSSLTSINIPNTVKSIGESAFAYCKSLTSINIPDSVTSIGDKAFAICI